MADPTPTIGQLVEQYQAGVLARDAEAMARLVESYGRVYTQITAQADALIAEVEKLIAQGQKPTQAQIRKLARYQRVMDDTRRQLERYGAVVEDEVRGAQLDAARLANEQLPALMTGILDGLPPDVAASMMNTWGVLPDDAVVALVGALQEGTPLAELLLRYGDDTAAQLGDVLVRGLASGIGARKVAAEMRRVLGIPLSDALRISRTEIMRAFRAATLADYRANSHIVKGWIWHSALDPRTCMACVAMHGTEHGLDESLDDHPSGRCSMIPLTVSPRDIGIDIDWEQEPVETGEAWFTRQTESVQREMMGPGKYEAWKEGKFKIADLVGRKDDPRWGTMRYERSLQDVLGSKGQTAAPVAARAEPQKPEVPRFKTSAEAEQWVRDQKLCSGAVSFKGFDVRVSQGIVESLAENVRRDPSLARYLRNIGNNRELNKIVREQARPQVEAEALKWASRFGITDPARLNLYVKQQLQSMGISVPARSYAMAYERDVYFSYKFASDADSFLESLSKGVRAGFHPHGTETVKAIMDHELGHSLDFAHKLMNRGGSPLRSLWYSTPGRDVANGLSLYAKKNEEEFLAEGWAEFLNNPTPRPLAMRIGNLVLDAIRGGK